MHYNDAAPAFVLPALRAVAATVVSCKTSTLHLKPQTSFVHHHAATLAFSLCSRVLHRLQVVVLRVATDAVAR